ncbi:MAG: hypothetical protein QM763_09145 [Agriterribacter sp.]
MQKMIFAIMLLLAACFSKTEKKVPAINNTAEKIHEPKYVWKKVLDSGSWKKSYNFQLFNIRDTLWIFHHDGNWYSADGKEWKKSSLPNTIHNLAFLDYVRFNNSIYGLGHFEGNIETYAFKPAIYQTTDMKRWNTIAANSNLPERFFYYPFVFNNKIWIIGGQDKTTTFSDILSSEDGITWKKEKDNLPFGECIQSQVVMLNRKLFLLNNDVWSSTDALNWQKETDEIVKGESIFGYAAIVFDNKIWLLGCNRNGKFMSEVLVSSDGKTWEAQHAPWSPRGGITAAVFKNKIYMTGGKYGGLPDKPEFVYSNDLWTLEKID